MPPLDPITKMRDWSLSNILYYFGNDGQEPFDLEDSFSVCCKNIEADDKRLNDIYFTNKRIK